MPAFIKARIEEITPRYANTLLQVSIIERSMSNDSIGTIPYKALVLLKVFEVRKMKKMWKKALLEVLPGESRINALMRVIKLK